MLYTENNSLIRIYEDETLQIEAWGENSLRVRVTRLERFTGEDWALIPQEELVPEIQIAGKKAAEKGFQANAAETISDDTAVLINGKVKAIVRADGKLTFENSEGKELLAEYDYENIWVPGIRSRELKSRSGDFAASYKFMAYEDEKLYGMGQYQNGIFNVKGAALELAQRNTQITVPFVYSSRGYGFLWNNPAIGRVTFGTNLTEWEAGNTKEMDFWITAGDSPREILSRYMEVTGLPPMMPEYGMGFWQCKLRYQTQEELLTVAREYHRRGLPLNAIVIDFFHWTLEGTWDFDKQYWPDPEGMVRELKEMGIELIVSIWPTVAVNAPFYQEMKERGELVRTEGGVNINMLMIDPTSFVDVTNPRARDFMWAQIKKNYVDRGIKAFWLDVAEPEYTRHDMECYRYYKGSSLEVGNIYPFQYSRMVYEGLLKEGEEKQVSLVRSAWAGSQRYGALAWSGDILSTFATFQKQVVCGLQMAMSGIPWWNTDIGGFHGGDVNDPEFQELLIRWFEYAAFCPVMRLHGDRSPHKPPMSTEGGGRCGSGADNEVWSYGEENYEIMKHYIEIREKLRPYTRRLMEESHESGAPVIRPLFYEFAEDKNAWDISNEYLYGSDLLVAPVTEYGKREWKVYLPSGENWVNVWTKEKISGGQWIICDAPLEQIPVFVRSGKEALVKLF